MANSVFIGLRDNSFVCKKDDNNPLVFTFEDIENRPHIPFYHQIWDDSEKHIKHFKYFVKNELNDFTIVSKLRKGRAFVAMPDDAISVEEQIVKEFLSQCGFREVTLISECMLLSRDYDAYVAVSFTCRMIVLSLIKEGNIIEQQYLINNNYSSKELKSYIEKLINNKEFERIPIFFNNTKIQEYKQLGTFVELESMLENYMYIIRNNKDLKQFLKG